MPPIFISSTMTFPTTCIYNMFSASSQSEMLDCTHCIRLLLLYMLLEGKNGAIIFTANSHIQISQFIMKKLNTDGIKQEFINFALTLKMKSTEKQHLAVTCKCNLLV